MIYITQLIYIQEGQEEVFHEFESFAIPLMEKYNGKLIQRIRPDQTAFIAGEEEKPYEIHIVSFDSQSDFDQFKMDEDRKKLIPLKEQSVRSIFMFQGTKI
ncbi:DUF1330 domain-containing protein [Reichenbachiella agarivorans]|uniref:DUF1330 domain-containing protein n=1 Tax=Reichenbachiella agarivorans TaxID=2979464 RepID=A0ABY6CSN5_9BACT|nr:DUF1330 domain-containing protein [Reichenbachiella agarivorans]UXP33530.1 DUF1330 domain-containing protein [Reichenbachiella agarivorans]